MLGTILIVLMLLLAAAVRTVPGLRPPLSRTAAESSGAAIRGARHVIAAEAGAEDGRGSIRTVYPPSRDPLRAAAIGRSGRGRRSGGNRGLPFIGPPFLFSREAH